MTFLWQRPILVGGLGLTFSVWLLDQVFPVVPDFAGTALWMTIALGSGFWVMQKQRQNAPLKPPTFTVDRPKVEKALASVETHINRLAQEASEESVLDLRQKLAHLVTEPDRQDLRVAVMGNPSVGKTTLTQLLVDLSAALLPETDLDLANVVPADVVLFLTTGDLTEPELRMLQSLTAHNHQVILALNKQDQYLPADRPVMLHQLHTKMQGLLEQENIVAIATQPAAFKVRQYQLDGSVQERLEQPTADIAPLQSRLTEILAERQSLVYATTYRQAQALNDTIKAEFNRIRRDRSLPIVEQYQWVAAAAAFANPVPSLDLLATATINTQMVMDLGTVYQQKFSVDQAKTVTTILASQMMKLGIVELSTQAIAPLLKSNVLTYVAGGTLQGLSAAHLTQLAGLSLVDYFEEQVQSLEVGAAIQIKRDSLIQKLQAVFQEKQQAVFFKTLVSQGVSRLLPAS
jgi:uncharacterized protein